MNEICGDIPLSLTDRARYLLCGLQEIVRSFGERCPVMRFWLDFRSGEVTLNIAEGNSPFRTYACALAEQTLARSAAPSGPVCDIGCGGGGHARLFDGEGPLHAYLGVDMTFNRRWASERPANHRVSCHFAQMAAERLGLVSKSLAFVFSSSALEHIADLRAAVRETARAMQPGACGLHIVPSVWSLFLYLFHGYRRFSPRALAELFQEAGLRVEQIWSLGGVPSFLLHAVWITWFETILLRKVLRVNRLARHRAGHRLYSWCLRAALRLDCALPFLPVGYGVLVRKPA